MRPQVAAFISFIVLCVSSSWGAMQYTFVDLSMEGVQSSTAYAINNSGQVVGFYRDLDRINHACIWDSGGARLDIPHAEGNWASDINDAGCIAGGCYVDREQRAFVWDLVGGMQILPTLGGSFGAGFSINEASQVAGRSQVEGLVNQPACLWQADTSVQNIGSMWYPHATAFAINNHGAIVGGGFNIGGDKTAFLWTAATGMQPLAVPGLSTAWGINDRGDIVGWYEVGESSYAFLVDSAGTLHELERTDDQMNSRADAINEQQQIVGSYRFGQGEWHACLWQGQDVVDLNSFVPANTGWLLTHASDINERGWISGYGIGPGGNQQAFMLIPEPATILLMGLGAIAVGRAMKRR